MDVLKTGLDCQSISISIELYRYNRLALARRLAVVPENNIEYRKQAHFGSNNNNTMVILVIISIYSRHKLSNSLMNFNAELSTQEGESKWMK